MPRFTSSRSTGASFMKLGRAPTTDSRTSTLAWTTVSFMYRLSWSLRYVSTCARRTPASGMGPITGSIRAGPGPTVKALVNWLSPSTSSRIWSLIWKSLVAAPFAVWAAVGPASSMSATRRTIVLAIMVSLDCYALRQVARPIHVAATQHGDMIGQQLQRNDRQHRRHQG